MVSVRVLDVRYIHNMISRFVETVVRPFLLDLLTEDRNFHPGVSVSEPPRVHAELQHSEEDKSNT
jgi:hypothetical protein